MHQRPKTIFQDSVRLTPANIDSTYKLRVSALVSFLIEAAWKHAEELGYGINYLHENNLVWVLSRLHLRILNLPTWNENLQILTWPKTIHRLFYVRDAEVKSPTGDTIALATSQWLIIDTTAKRPKLVDITNPVFSENADIHAIDNIEPVVNIPEGQKVSSEFQPAYSDIDLNQHLTTTRYIDKMMDSLPFEIHRKNKVSELMINFRKEIAFNTRVSIEKATDTTRNEHFFQFTSNAGKTNHCAGRITFSPNV